MVVNCIEKVYHHNVRRTSDAELSNNKMILKRERIPAQDDPENGADRVGVGMCPSRNVPGRRSVMRADRRRTESRQSGASHCAAETPALSSVAGERGFADPIFQRKRDPHA
jgi:hypothetical protein